jgi:hypothetical protein
MYGRPSDLLLCIAASTLWIGLQGVSDARDDSAFDQSARTALAQSLRPMRAVPSGPGGQLRSIDDDVALTFTTAAGKTITVHHVELSDAQRDDLVGGRPLILEYLPGDPTTVRFPGWQPQPAYNRWILLTAGVLASVGFWFLRKREQRIIRAALGPRKYDGPLRPGDPRPWI